MRLSRFRSIRRSFWSLRQSLEHAPDIARHRPLWRHRAGRGSRGAEQPLAGRSVDGCTFPSSCAMAFRCWMAACALRGASDRTHPAGDHTLYIGCVGYFDGVTINRCSSIPEISAAARREPKSHSGRKTNSRCFRSVVLRPSPRSRGKPWHYPRTERWRLTGNSVSTSLLHFTSHFDGFHPEASGTRLKFVLVMKGRSKY